MGWAWRRGGARQLRACLHAGGWARKQQHLRQPRERQSVLSVRPVLPLLARIAGCAAVVAADADFQIGLHLAPALGADLHELADALAVDGDERVDLEHIALRI